MSAFQSIFRLSFAHNPVLIRIGLSFVMTAFSQLHNSKDGGHFLSSFKLLGPFRANFAFNLSFKRLAIYPKHHRKTSNNKVLLFTKNSQNLTTKTRSYHFHSFPCAQSACHQLRYTQTRTQGVCVIVFWIVPLFIFQF